MDTVDRSDDNLILCVLFGVFVGFLSRQTFKISPDEMITLSEDYVPEFDLSDGSINSTYEMLLCTNNIILIGPGSLGCVRLRRAFAALASCDPL